jgi:hypothetical protein
MVPTELAHANACEEIEAAYAKLVKTAEGTPERDEALEGFILLLFRKDGGAVQGHREVRCSSIPAAWN